MKLCTDVTRLEVDWKIQNFVESAGRQQRMKSTNVDLEKVLGIL